MPTRPGPGLSQLYSTLLTLGKGSYFLTVRNCPGTSPVDLPASAGVLGLKAPPCPLFSLLRLSVFSPLLAAYYNFSTNWRFLSLCLRSLPFTGGTGLRNQWPHSVTTCHQHVSPPKTLLQPGQVLGWGGHPSLDSLTGRNKKTKPSNGYLLLS